MRFFKLILITAAISLLPLASQAANVKSSPTRSMGSMTLDDFSGHITSDHLTISVNPPMSWLA